MCRQWSLVLKGAADVLKHPEQETEAGTAPKLTGRFEHACHVWEMEAAWDD